VFFFLPAYRSSPVFNSCQWDRSGSLNDSQVGTIFSIKGGLRQYYINQDDKSARANAVTENRI
jgi:hypothetical protein